MEANEKRLINAWKLVIDLAKMKRYGEYDYEDIMAVIASQETVDAVEVVRCKDCKHGIWDEDEKMFECVNQVDLTGDADTYAMFHEYNNGEHFCSYGERKNNAD